MATPDDTKWLTKKIVEAMKEIPRIHQYRPYDRVLFGNEPIPWHGTNTQSDYTDESHHFKFEYETQHEEPKMNNPLHITLNALQADEGMKTVEVEFLRGNNHKPYVYKTLIPVKEDDIVVVQVYDPDAGGNVVSTARVSKIHKTADVSSEKRLKWVVANITEDAKKWEDQIEKEDEFVNHLATARVRKEAKEFAAELGIETGSGLFIEHDVEEVAKTPSPAPEDKTG